jgi:putative copper export protein
VSAVGVTIVGWLPWFTWAFVENGSRWAWARFLLKGAVFVDLPNMAIGEAVVRLGWTGLAPLVIIHLLTIAFWFGVIYAFAVVLRQLRLRHAQV